MAKRALERKSPSRGKPARDLTSLAKSAHVRLQRICARLPEVEYTLSFGNPAFKAGGKLFAVLDSYQGRDCLWLRVAPFMRSELLRTPGWFASPYDPRKQALCVAVEEIDWRKIRPLVRLSYLQVIPASDAAPASARRSPSSRASRYRSRRG